MLRKPGVRLLVGDGRHAPATHLRGSDRCHRFGTVESMDGRGRLALYIASFFIPHASG